MLEARVPYIFTPWNFYFNHNIFLRFWINTMEGFTISTILIGIPKHTIKTYWLLTVIWFNIHTKTRNNAKCNIKNYIQLLSEEYESLLFLLFPFLLSPFEENSP